jgi:hypothetical protein
MGFGSNPFGRGPIITGLRAVERKLNRLATTSSKKATVAGHRASMTTIAKAMRSAVNASDASTFLKREARKSIGARFSKGMAKELTLAKVGFSVGKKAKQVKSAQAARGKRLGAGKGGGRGVGISAANIHWFVLGTKKRRTKSGFGSGEKGTGQIANVFGDVTRLAFAASHRAAVVAARKKIWAVMKKEAMRRV